MATLFQRMSGDILDDEQRIPIHGLRSMLREIQRGALVRADLVSMYSLTPPQRADLITLLGKANGSVNKQAFMRFLFDWLALAELGIPGYKDEAAFWARVELEIA